MLEKLLEFVGLPSPAVLLAVLAIGLGACGWSYHLGTVNGGNEREAFYSAQKDVAAEALRDQLAAANGRALAAETLARTVADQNATLQSTITPLLKGIRDAKPLPANCMPDDLRVRLNDTIRTINQYGNPSSGNPLRLPNALSSPAGS